MESFSETHTCVRRNKRICHFVITNHNKIKHTTPGVCFFLFASMMSENQPSIHLYKGEAQGT